MQLNDVGDEVQLGMNDPLREKRHKAAGESDCNTKTDGNPPPDLLSLAHQIFGLVPVHPH